ncbi:unnamed protein product [Ixodes hexagonus]
MIDAMFFFLLGYWKPKWKSNLSKFRKVKRAFYSVIAVANTVLLASLLCQAYVSIRYAQAWNLSPLYVMMAAHVLLSVEFFDSLVTLSIKNYCRGSCLHISNCIAVVWGIWINFVFGGPVQAVFVMILSSMLRTSLHAMSLLCTPTSPVRKLICSRVVFTRMQFAQCLAVFVYTAVRLLCASVSIGAFAAVVAAEVTSYVCFYLDVYRVENRRTLRVVSRSVEAAIEALTKLATACSLNHEEEEK